MSPGKRGEQNYPARYLAERSHQAPYITHSVVIITHTTADFFDLAWSYLQRAAAQNLAHSELFFDAQVYTARGVPFQTIVAGYRRVILKAAAKLRVLVLLILCFLRDRGADFAMATLMEALPYKEWIIGVGLNSDE